MEILRTLLIKLFLICCFAINGTSQEKIEIENRIEALNSINEIKVKLHPLVWNQIQKFSKRKSFPKTMGLAKFYFPLFKTKLKLYDLPEELKYLTIVESNLKTRATSKVGAQGLWQFMRPTGKSLGLYENQYINLFNDPIASTDAACRYLKQLYTQLGDWELALAAYNCGIGRVKRILKKTGKTSFWEILPYLPEETRLYVPSFLAVQFLMNYYSDFGIKPYTFAINYSDVRLNKAESDMRINRSSFTNQRGKNIFMFLNPHLKTLYIPKGTYYYSIKKPAIVDSRLILN